MSARTDIRVVLIDDDVATRDSIRAVIDSQPDMRVVGETSACSEGADLVRAHDARVLVVGSGSPGKGCADLLNELQRQGLRAGVIVLTEGSEQNGDVLRLVQAGASAYLRKSEDAGEVVEAIRVVASGGHILEPAALDAVLKDYCTRCSQDGEEKTEELSAREREVLTLVAEGLSTREIATQLGLSHKTVEVHRRNIMVKLHRHRVADLVRYAVREGLVGLD
ncbi:MAG: response regulator transcription factor [Actinobacteria bacterium]|nr:response regulator transcription factor [Actinomycetota bacterium]